MKKASEIRDLFVFGEVESVPFEFVEASITSDHHGSGCSNSDRDCGDHDSGCVLGCNS